MAHTEAARDPPLVAAVGRTSLQERIEDKTARVAIIGQGYVGLPLAVEFARAGFRVTGRDNAAERVAALTRGESYIPDVPVEDLQQVIQAGRYVATSDVAALVEQDAVVLCVPTPLRKSKDPDVSHVVTAARDVARVLAPGQLVVVGVSPQRIAAAWTRIRRGRWRAGRLPALWDGHAAERIIDVLTSNAGIAGSIRSRSRRRSASMARLTAHV